MALLKLLGWVWLIMLGISVIGFLFGIVVENYVPDDNPIKKWWRKNIVDADPEDENIWKNFGG